MTEQKALGPHVDTVANDSPTIPSKRHPEALLNVSELGDDSTPESADTSARLKVTGPRLRGGWRRAGAFAILPGLAMSSAAAAGFLKYEDGRGRAIDTARTESIEAAKDSTVALLSYRPDTAEQQLSSALHRLTGTFKDAYASLTRDVVIPAAKQQNISAAASVPAAATVSATPNHVVALVFVNQTVTVSDRPPSDTSSTVRVTLDNVDGRWLISGFDPV